MSESLKVQFGRNVASYRESLHLTQEQMAEICNVSVETISHIERGIHGPRFDLLETIATCLEVSVQTLFDFD